MHQQDREQLQRMFPESEIPSAVVEMYYRYRKLRGIFINGPMELHLLLQCVVGTDSDLVASTVEDTEGLSGEYAALQPGEEIEKGETCLVLIGETWQAGEYLGAGANHALKFRVPGDDKDFRLVKPEKVRVNVKRLEELATG